MVGVVSEVVDMLLCWQSKSKEATPVTLACEDDQRLDKVILAAISPFSCAVFNLFERRFSELLTFFFSSLPSRRSDI